MWLYYCQHPVKWKENLNFPCPFVLKITCSALSVWNVNLMRTNNSVSLFWVNDEIEMKFSNLYFTWSTYGLFVVILGNVFPDLEIRMSEHALKVSCGPQPIALVPFGQLPHELAVLYVHWKYFVKKILRFNHFQKVAF